MNWVAKKDAMVVEFFHYKQTAHLLHMSVHNVVNYEGVVLITLATHLVWMWRALWIHLVEIFWNDEQDDGIVLEF